MLRILLKKQLMEIFRSYFYNQKTNTAMSKSGTIGRFALYFGLLFGYLGFLISRLCLALCGPLVSAGAGWLYYLLLTGLAVVLGAFGSAFSTYSGLYMAKDNDLMLSLPIRPRDLIVSRLFSVYLMGLLYSAIVSLPGTIIYWVKGVFAPASVIGALVWMLLLSLFVLVLSSALGWVGARFSMKMKRKNIGAVVVTLVFLGVYFAVFSAAQEKLRALLADAAGAAEKIRGSSQVLYQIGRVGEGDPFATLLVSLVVCALLALTLFLLAKTFLKIARSTAAVSKTRYRERSVRQKSPLGALIGKELGRFTASSGYMLNCGLGLVFLIAAGVALLWKGRMVSETLSEVFGSLPGFDAVLLCAAVCLISGMNNMVVPSVSLEGRNFWIARSLPVSSLQILQAKMGMQVVLCAPPVLFASICAAICVHARALTAVLMILVPLAYCLFAAAAGGLLSLMSPNLKWTNELYPIKQSLNVLISVFGGWIVSGLYGAGFLPLGGTLGVNGYLALGVVLFAALAWVCWSAVKKRGPAVLKSL